MKRWGEIDKILHVCALLNLLRVWRVEMINLTCVCIIEFIKSLEGGRDKTYMCVHYWIYFIFKLEQKEINLTCVCIIQFIFFELGQKEINLTCVCIIEFFLSWSKKR